MTRHPFMGALDIDHFMNKLQEGSSSALLLAARDKDLKSCLMALQTCGEDPEATTKSKLTLLHFAAVNQEHGVEIFNHFKKIVQMKEDIDGEWPIHYALRKGDFHFATLMHRSVTQAAGSENLVLFFVTKNSLDFAKFVCLREEKLIYAMDSIKRAFHYAARFAGREMCEWLCERFLDPNFLTKNKESPLHFAAMNKKHGVELVKFFASQGLNLDHKNNLERAPLHFALEAENLDVATQLVESGASITIKISESKTLMHFCAYQGRLESAEWLHSRNRFLINELCKDRMTPLHVAAMKGHFNFCKWLVVQARDKDLKTCTRLVNEGADPKEVSDCGLTLLHFAAINQDHGVEIYSYFYNLILDREDVDGEEPIHYALRKGDYNFAVEMLRLRKAGADNLLHYFVMHNNLDFAKLVLERDPDLIRFVDNRSKTLLHFAAQYANRSMCEWLVGQKLAPDAQSDRGSTPMHFAMRNRQHGADLASFFASKVPKWNKMNKHGLTPLHWALQYENLEAATRLLDLGCSIRIITKDMKNLLHFCAEKNKLKSAKLVHRWDGNLIGKTCLDGMTALHFAAKNGDWEFCDWLIDSGVDVVKLDIQGRSASNYVNNENEELYDLLMEAEKIQRS
ncbi:putative ankyrin repeat protein RF_0381 [Cloeon dipterum]|uniref:putative ankyrin repeat protein RF_0381 n=1 Tax=Cloeon dipterum TaxID=197152 RepID=UPI00321FD329